jgi:eukaryotic-like serine/threonine-protein kinase
MATVYLAQDLRHRRPVAIKVLHAELAQALGAERFLHEIEIVARLQHPHILPLHDSGEAGGLLYYVMPYVAGESLRSRLTREKQLPLEHAVQIANQVASALAYAHERGVVHRDIKPENILLEGDQAVLADFGIAGAVSAAGGERLTETGLALGTPAYMSPEQGAGERHLDARSDVYSLGCVVYEMLAGEPPFTGPTAQAVIAKRFGGPVPRVRIVREEIPETVDGAIARALAKAPADRFTGASQFALALTPALHPAADLPRTSAVTVGPSHRWISQRLTKLVVGAALVMLAGVGGALLMRRTPPPALDPNLVAVAPFDVFDSQLALWREGLVDVLSANLDGAGPLRTVSPTLVVRRWRGRADRSSATDLGRRTGAGLALFGQLVGVAGDSMRLRATLLDVPSGRVVGEFEQRAPSASMDRLTDSLTVALFRELGRGKPIGAVRFAGLGSTSLPALKAFLQGEQFYRRSAWDSAAAYYQRAIALDSTFAFALYHLSKALKWGAHVGDSPGPALASGLRAGALNRGLAPRESLLVAADSLFSAIGLATISDDTTFIDDELDTVAVARLRSRLFAALEEGTRRYPEDPEIWFELGDTRFHLGWRIDMSAQQALATLDRAIALDSAFAPSYLHAADLASYLGDAAALRRYVAGYSVLSPSPDDSLRLIDRLLDPGRAATAETEHLLKVASVDALGEAWGLLQTLRDSAEVGVRVARLLAGRQGASASLAGDSIVRRRLLASTLAYRGHLREAYQNVGREDSGFFFSLFGELALLGGVPPDTAAALFRRWLHRTPFWPERLFNGLVTALPWWTARGDTLSLREFVRRSDSATRSSTYWKDMDPGDPRYGASAARAYLAVARGDTAEAIRRLAAMRLTGRRIFPRCGYCWLEGLTYARLLEATGRHEAAFALLDPGFPQRHAYPIRPLWTLERARVADRLGEREKAIESYRFITEVWRNADPELQPYVAEAHAALRRYAEEESR